VAHKFYYSERLSFINEPRKYTMLENNTDYANRIKRQLGEQSLFTWEGSSNPKYFFCSSGYCTLCHASEELENRNEGTEDTYKHTSGMSCKLCGFHSYCYRRYNHGNEVTNEHISTSILKTLFNPSSLPKAKLSELRNYLRYSQPVQRINETLGIYEGIKATDSTLIVCQDDVYGKLLLIDLIRPLLNWEQETIQFESLACTLEAMVTTHRIRITMGMEQGEVFLKLLSVKNLDIPSLLKLKNEAYQNAL